MAALERRGNAGAPMVGFHANAHDCDRGLCAALCLFVLPRYPQNQAHLVVSEQTAEGSVRGHPPFKKDNRTLCNY